MTKLSRYSLILVTILTLSIVLPKLFWTAFDTPVKIPYTHYSCIIDDYTIYNQTEKTRTDAKGNSYTRDEYEQLLPLMYTRQLLIDEKMPDSIKGIETDMHKFSSRRSFCRIRPSDFLTPLPKLYPLIESESGRASLKLPEDVFRIDWRVDFINANTNEVDEEKSRLFSAALFHKGFTFPATRIAGIPSTRKSCDEGYLVVDSKDQIYHFKMIKSLPYVRRVNTPADLHFKHIACVDFKDKRYYAYLISEDNGIYILTQDDYKLVRLPIEDYSAEVDQLKILGDYFNYNVTVQSNNTCRSYALDRDYKLVGSYEYKWQTSREGTMGSISASIFPFECSLTSKHSRYINLYPTMPKGFIWMIFNLLLISLQLVIIRKRKVAIKNQIIDLFFIVTTGIFGFIAVNIFPNKTIS